MATFMLRMAGRGTNPDRTALIATDALSEGKERATEVNGPTHTCKDYWMKLSIFYRSLGPDTNSGGMRQQRSRAISTKPVTFFIKIRTHARGLKSGQCCIHL